jgi:uncharacterized membrane protein YGL010W
MSALNDYFSSYNEYHQTQGNKLTHYLGIPLIVFSTLGLLAMVSVGGWFDLGLVLWLASSVFYCRLDWKRGLPFALLTFGFYWFSRWVTWDVHVGLFIVGWILQGIGHYKYEKKSPAFLTNLSHLLIGPFWIFCRLLRF